MKRFMYTCFVAFWASVASIWAFAVLAGDARDKGADAAPGGPADAVNQQTLAQHDSADDCWMAIDGVVYDFTGYLDQHPAPPSVMEPWCGKEASEAYHTKGYGRDHSPAADAMLPDYRVGDYAPAEAE